MKKLRVLLVLELAAIGCSSKSALPPVAVVAVTPVGEARGNPVQMMVGATGGTLTSADGRLKVEVPPGALAIDQLISIQPITDEAPGGAGAAYRLGPDGQTFLAPVTLAFTYSSADIAGSEPLALGIAYQDSQGRWNSLKSITRDDVAKTLAVVTSHFSDWTLAMNWQLTPPVAMVHAAEAVDLVVEYCGYQDEGDELTQLVLTCEPDVGIFSVQEWAVNAIVNGDGSVGTVDSVANGSGPVMTPAATYTAPAVAPPANPVAVSASMIVRSDNRKVVLVSNVWIDARPPLTGTVTTTQKDSANDSVVITTNATDVNFVWDTSVGGIYLTTGGSLAATWDVVTTVCETHLTAAMTIGNGDGQILLTGDGGYFPAGSTTGIFTGTSSCPAGGNPQSVTQSEAVEWWPAQTGQVSIKPDGRLEESIPETVIGTKTVTMQWSFVPVPP